MKLSTFKRLFKGDYAQQLQAFVEQLSLSLNPAIESIYDALNQKLSLGDNFLCDVKDVTLTVDSSGKPTSTTAFTIDTTRITNLKGLQVIRALSNTTSNIYPTGGIFISYTQTATAVQIVQVTGLPAGTPFTLRVIAWG